MSDFSPITVSAVDNQRNKLFEYSVPFRFEITARQVLECAFVLAQTSAQPDPFVFTLEYFGYSESQQYPGYLGYEIESIGQLANTASFYWDLLVDGVPSSHGADTTFPGPGSTVTWQYTAIPPLSGAVSPRASAIQSRRAQRT
jgi:Domain of unknown function (DUF4430)